MDSSLSSFLENSITTRVTIPGIFVGCGNSTTRREHIRQPGVGPDQFVLSWILKGKGFFSENGHEYRITDMCYCLRRPGKDWYMVLDSSESVRIYLDLPIAFYPALCMMIPEIDSLPPVRKVEFRRELLEEYRMLQKKISHLQLTGFYTVVPDIVNFILNVTGIAAERDHSPLNHARRLLEDPASTLSLEEISESCKINYNTFRKSFTDTFGISPGQYRIACKMEAARRALIAGETVATAAEHCGFPDVYSFTKRFSSFYGMPPGKYKTEHSG